MDLSSPSRSGCKAYWQVPEPSIPTRERCNTWVPPSRHLSGIGPWVRHVDGLAGARPHSNPHRSDRPDSRHRRSARYRHSQDCKIMNSKPIKIPGPDHPITITPTKGRVTATVNGKRVADTREALTLK